MANNKEINDEKGAAQKIPTRNFLDIFNPGYILAGMATLATAIMSVNKNSQKYFQQHGVFDALNEDHDNAIKALVTDPTKDLKDGLPAIDKFYRQKRADLLRGGTKIDKIAPGRIEGILDRWKVLEPHHKIQTGLTFGAVAFIGMGAIYSYTRQRKLNDKLHRQIIENTEQQRGI